MQAPSLEKMINLENMISEDDMFLKLVTEPHPCILLNPDLSEERMQGIKNTFHIIQTEFNGILYNAVVVGYYRQGILPTNGNLGARKAQILATSKR